MSVVYSYKELFPFAEYRNGQEPFMKVVATALSNKKDVLADIPTGVGKTAAVLTAALEYALKHNKKVLFLTSKHTHHRIAVDTLKKIKEKCGFNLQVTDFIGKVWMCGRPEVDPRNAGAFWDYCKHLTENKECEFYENFHSKRNMFSNKLLMDELKNKIHNVDELFEKCKESKVCPYEAASLLAKKSKVIVADYYHILDSGIRPSFLKKINCDLNDCIIVWDEAHNLPDRARNLMSDSLNTLGLDSAISEANKLDKDAEEEIFEIKNKLAKLNDKYHGTESLVEKDEFGSFDEEFIEKLDNMSDDVLKLQQRSYLRSLAYFLSGWNVEGKEFSRILKTGKTNMGKNFIVLEKNCLDPSVAVGEIISEAHSNIFMSGTLCPLEMYEKIFGLDLPLKIDLSNPYPAENRLDLVVPVVNTKFSMRSDQMFERIALNCKRIIEVIPGNKIFFFPSYALLDSVNSYCEEDIIIEERGMDKNIRESILNRFKISRGNTLFAVSAGGFGESVDLFGDALSAVIVVGVPFGKYDLMSKELVRYYDEKFGRGQEYGYVMPAFTKVLQNAGRCIRSEKDRGVIIYLDERYSWRAYHKYFPISVNLVESKNYEKVKEFFS